MVERGGTATQAGINYQNSVAALALADALDLDDRLARDRVVEVRVEAPEAVDDVVVRFADHHREFRNIKLSLKRGTSAWAGIWRSLSGQFSNTNFGAADKLIIVVSEETTDSKCLRELCARASDSVDDAEWRASLTQPQAALLDNLNDFILAPTKAFELLRRVDVHHLPERDIPQEFGRRRLAGARSTPPSLLNVLRDLVAQGASRRAIFQPGPLRRRLRLEHDIQLEEPSEWGLQAYRETVRRLARLEVPGAPITTPVDEVFVWPRTRYFDRSRRTDFEDENQLEKGRLKETGPDLRSFPSDGLRHLVVIAGPGHGKTALITALTARLCADVLTPVAVSLAALADADEPILTYLYRHLRAEMNLSADWERLAEQGLLVLLLDGLDEVPSATRPRLMERLATYTARFPDSPWLLTVRDAAVVTKLPEAVFAELLALDDDDIARFVDIAGERADGLKGWQVVNRLRHYPDLERLARIPLFLAMLLASNNFNTAAPLTRRDLIEAYLRTLFERPDASTIAGPNVTESILRSVAQTLAFDLLEQQRIGATLQDVRRVIAAAEPDLADAILSKLIRNGILKPQGAVRLHFPYPIVQEYLAACELVNRHSETLVARIDDAVQRPWAQVLQFALELHSGPEPIIRTMLEKSDDAFYTGLRLVGRCIANGAKVTASLRRDVGDRLVAFWIDAPSRARESVGRLLADGFASPPSSTLRAALSQRHLIGYGAGDIVSQLNDQQLTLEVLEALIKSDSTIHIYHSLKPALRNAGDDAIRMILKALDPTLLTSREIDDLSYFFIHFDPTSVSRDLILGVARDRRLPDQARMRAYILAGAPLEDEAVCLVRESFRHPDKKWNYEALRLPRLHHTPESFITEIFIDAAVPLDRRIDLAAEAISIFRDTGDLTGPTDRIRANAVVPKEVKIALALYLARFGDHEAFSDLVEGIAINTIAEAGTTIALFGHYPDRTLAERAAALARARCQTPADIIHISTSTTTGMLHVFEMDYGFGGVLLSAPPHPGLEAWRSLVEDWTERTDFSLKEKLDLLTTASQLGSEQAVTRLGEEISAIENFDALDWIADDEFDRTLSSALYQLQQHRPALSPALIDKCLASPQYNIISRGVQALAAASSIDALTRLLEINAGHPDSHIRDMAANAIELLAAKLGQTVIRHADRYLLQKDNPEKDRV